MRRRLFALLPFLLLCACAHRTRRPPQATAVLQVNGKPAMECAIPAAECEYAASGAVTISRGDTITIKVRSEAKAVPAGVKAGSK